MLEAEGCGSLGLEQHGISHFRFVVLEAVRKDNASAMLPRP